ncbi:hypothetical protein [Microcoleus sp. EPA2]
MWGQLDDIERLPAIEPYQEGDMPHSIRVAVASNKSAIRGVAIA